MKNILVGGAWPYANGSLHIGHIAALLPADIVARYHRAKGDNVYYVSGSDCHGTPVAIRAKQENKAPQEVSDFYHKEFCECFKKLGFSYDLYTKTSSKEHKDFVRDFHKTLYNSDYIYEKDSEQVYCEHCKTFLSDRFVHGKCPICENEARGDQCDACGMVLEPENLIEPFCSICGTSVSFRKSKHLYIAISKLENQLKSYVNEHTAWRKNAITFSNRYISEGLRDRALTRDLDWGIDVPYVGYQDKKIYIWAENVLGYLSASKVLAENRNEDFKELWGSNAKHYYVHGKDNIPFHTIILPSLLLTNDFSWHLPDEIISSEYLTLEGKKISTSQNYAIWVKDIVNQYNPDSLRYYLISNGPEKKDSDFSWREYVTCHNSELLGAYGNFINRSLSFINKYLENIVPVGKLELSLENDIDSLYNVIGSHIEIGNFRDAIGTIFTFVRRANKYFDTEQPWISRSTDLDACKNTLFNCVQIIANLAILLQPFLPFSSAKVCEWLQVSTKWEKQFVKTGYYLPEISLLFERLDKKIIDDEVSKLIV